MNHIVAQSSTDIIAMIGDEPVTELPTDLFIPPEALTVLLEQFSGPLDLLLYLIRKQNIDILDIPIVSITQQYMQYIALMQSRSLDLTAEYLLMAATLAEIKSRMLLPRPVEAEEEEEEADPRMELVRRIQAYEQMKMAALAIDELPRCDRDIFLISVPSTGTITEKSYPEVGINDLVSVMLELEKKISHKTHHAISRENFSVRERMRWVLERLQPGIPLDFFSILDLQEGRGGIIAYFLAILELSKQSLLSLQQEAPFQPIVLYCAQYIGVSDE